MLLPPSDALPKIVHDHKTFLQSLKISKVVPFEVEVNLFVPNILNLSLERLILGLEVL